MEHAHIDNPKLLTGPDDYLPFSLAALKGGPGEIETRIKEELFFSLTAAICALIAEERLRSIDPQIAAVSNTLHMKEIAVRSAYTLEPYGELLYGRPGAEPDQPYDGPGIYLHARLGSVWLQQMTGLPFPKDDDLEDATMILLAQYDNTYQKLIFTDTYQQLSTAASNYAATQRTSIDPLDYTVVFKGRPCNEQVSFKGYPIQGYRDYHHFPNSYEAIRYLMLEDTACYNHRCAGEDYNFQHDFAYVLSPTREPVVVVRDVPIASIDKDEGTAGIWLEVAGGIDRLSERLGIDIPTWTGQPRSDTSLQLAEYKYDRYLSLHANPNVLGLLDALQHERDAFLGYPFSPYLLSLHYEIAPVSGEPAPVLDIRHYYYHTDCRAALFQMINCEMPLIMDGGDRLPLWLSKVTLSDRRGQPLAALETSRPRGEADRVLLSVFPLLAERAGNLYEAMWNLSGAKGESPTGNVPLSFTIADYDTAHLQWRPVPIADTLAQSLKPQARPGADTTRRQTAWRRLSPDFNAATQRRR